MEQAKIGLNTFLSGIYKKMALGVGVTAITSYILLSTDPGFTILKTIFSSQWYYYGIVAIELALLWFIQTSMQKLSKEKATGLFYLYAILNGLTLTGIFLIYTGGSILNAFISAVVVFGTLAVIGTKTEKDITGWGSFLIIGMWGIFIVSIINIFIGSSAMDMIISAVAVLIFSGLTLYDAQVYKNYYVQSAQGTDHDKMTTLGALHMYINFIMIFVSLLKLFGKRN